jgi:DNA-binding transcriptional MerR regulator
MNEFTIKDLENLSGIKAHTIRIWEQRYSFLKPRRSDTNIRYYDSEELRTLLNFALLNKSGFKISAIAKMNAATIHEKILSLSSSEAQQQRLINELLNSMIHLDSMSFEKVLDQYIAMHGVQKTITDLIFPFLHRVGILWMTNHVRVAQEHLVSNIVRQKLIRGIEEIAVNGTNGKTVVLFLPDGEYHELGLLYVHYLLKLKGVNIIYLGADVPVSELEYVCELKRPRYLYTHLTSLPTRFNFEKYLSHFHQRITSTPLMISGNVTRSYMKKVPDGINFLKSLEEVIDQLAA